MILTIVVANLVNFNKKITDIILQIGMRGSVETFYLNGGLPILFKPPPEQKSCETLF